jgi:hypothetical protein
MAAKAEIWIRAFLSGLGIDIDFPMKYNLSNTPTAHHSTTIQQSVADTDEALDLGGVSTVDMIILYAKTNDVDIDTSFSAAFSKELSFTEGEVQVFKPEGTVYFKNGTAAEQATIQYLVIGR